MSDPTVEVVYHGGTFAMPAGYDPPPDRFASTPGDNLVELAGRVCYDSINRNRRGKPTADYHAHLLATGHYSVHAHAVKAFEVRRGPHGPTPFDLLASLQCRPGVWVTAITREGFRFAASMRAALEWGLHGPGYYATGASAVENHYRELGLVIGDAVAGAFRRDFPLCMAKTPARVAGIAYGLAVEEVGPVYPQEQWVSLYVAGVSRDLLQELVRHHYQTNFSVRSTRYVDESNSRQVTHPAVLEADPSLGLASVALGVYDLAKQSYAIVYDRLAERGVDTKTARGAARSLLPGATETRMVFSLSRFQASHILGLRLGQNTGPADPEIVRFARKLADVLRAPPVGWAV